MDVVLVCETGISPALQPLNSAATFVAQAKEKGSCPVREGHLARQPPKAFSREF